MSGYDRNSEGPRPQCQPSEKADPRLTFGSPLLILRRISLSTWACRAGGAPSTSCNSSRDDGGAENEAEADVDVADMVTDAAVWVSLAVDRLSCEGREGNPLVPL